MIEIKGGEDEDLGHRKVLDDPAGCLDAAGTGHADIHQDDIGTQFPRELDGFGAVAGLPDGFHVRLGLQDHGERHTEQ